MDNGCIRFLIFNKSISVSQLSLTKNSIILSNQQSRYTLSKKYNICLQRLNKYK